MFPIRPALSCLAVLLAAASPALAQAGGAREGLQISLPGEDPATYRSLRGTSPDACASACGADSWCTGWTLTAPTFRIGPRCELKHVVPARTPVADTPARRSAKASAPVTPPVKAPTAKAPHPAVSPTPPEPVPVPALRGAQDQPAPKATTEPEFTRPRYAPAPATGEDKRPALPDRRDRQVPAYSVQEMDVLPGDYEATAGYLDGLPDEDEAGQDAGN